MRGGRRSGCASKALHAGEVPAAVGDVLGERGATWSGRAVRRARRAPGRAACSGGGRRAACRSAVAAGRVASSGAGALCSRANPPDSSTTSCQPVCSANQSTRSRRWRTIGGPRLPVLALAGSGRASRRRMAARRRGRPRGPAPHRGCCSRSTSPGRAVDTRGHRPTPAADGTRRASGGQADDACRAGAWRSTTSTR